MQRLKEDSDKDTTLFFKESGNLYSVEFGELRFLESSNKNNTDNQ